MGPRSSALPPPSTSRSAVSAHSQRSALGRGSVRAPSPAIPRSGTWNELGTAPWAFLAPVVSSVPTQPQFSPQNTAVAVTTGAVSTRTVRTRSALPPASISISGASACCAAPGTASASPRR